MAREDVKRATIKDLIARKTQREADKFKTVDVFVPSMNATLVFKKPSDVLLMDTIDEMGDGTSTRQQMDAMKKLIYQTCDLLQSPELHKGLDITDPFDAVDAIFDLADIGSIPEQIAELFGMNGVEDKVKNL